MVSAMSTALLIVTHLQINKSRMPDIEGRKMMLVDTSQLLTNRYIALRKYLVHT